MWPDNRIISLFNIEHPILLAPMAGPGGAELASSVAKGGGLASLPCAMLSAERIRQDVSIIRGNRSTPINLNFFCHTPEPADPARDAQWSRVWLNIMSSLGLILKSRQRRSIVRLLMMKCARWLRNLARKL